MIHPCERKGVLCGHRRRASGTSGFLKICHYILDTGKQRGCPAGRTCKHWTADKCEMLPELRNF